MRFEKTLNGVYNIKTNDQFWEASAANCITIVIALLISYWLVQRKNDLRKQKELIANLILDLRSQLDKEDMYDLSNKSEKDINMRNRDISNKIEILDGIKGKFKIESGVDFISEKFDEYKEFIGNHIDDRDYLISSHSELKRPILLISNKLFEISLHIGNGKHSIKQSLNLFRDEMAEYVAITDKIKAKSKERKTLLTEKKETPVVHVLKHRDLAKRIAEMTEDLEELRSEKAVLLRRMEFPENATADSFRKEIRTLEDGLKKLEASEAKYAAELDNALKQYAELQAQAAKFDPLELYEARRTIRPEQERQTAQRVQDAYGEKYDLMMMYDSKRHVANLLHEEAEARSIREHLLQKQQRQAQQKQNKKKSRDSWER